MSGTVSALHTFYGGSSDGYGIADLILGHDGNIYGITDSGGTNNGGAIFTISSAGVVATIFSFGPPVGIGSTYNPTSILEAEDGNFYGTTRNGGIYGGGAIFRVTPSGSLTDLYNLNYPDLDPSQLYDAFLSFQASDYNLYGRLNVTKAPC